MGSCYLVLRQGLCPNACFHHIAVKLTTELQRCGTAEYEILRYGVKPVCCKRFLLRSDIKFHFLLIIVVHRKHATEYAAGQYTRVGAEGIDIHLIGQEEEEASFCAS